MLKNWKLGIVLAAAAVLSACGGGGSGSDPTPRGAIAVQPANGFGAIGVNYTSQPEANSRALDDCGGADSVRGRAGVRGPWDLWVHCC